jgi:hypothetical protein
LREKSLFLQRGLSDAIMDIYQKNLLIDIDFPRIKGFPSIFIDKITLGKSELETLNSSTFRELYIFGTIVKTDEIRLNKPVQIKRLEFIVIEKKVETNEFIQHHLAQYNSVMYKREKDVTTSSCADMIKKKDILYLKHFPKWKISEASIPEFNNKLFYFCSQIFLPENDTTKQYMSWGQTIFIFLHVKEDDELLVQIFTQDTSLQTAEDHYKLEEQMSQFDKNYGKIEVVKKMIKKGDKFLHEYILNHKKINKEILEILLEYGTSKQFKSEVLKKLKN